MVLGHSIILYPSAWDLYSTEVTAPFLDLLKKCIDPIQMPLFFSLSGYLFVLTHKKKRGFSHLLKNKASSGYWPVFYAAHPAIVVFINLVVWSTVAYGLTTLVRKTKLRIPIGE